MRGLAKLATGGFCRGKNDEKDLRGGKVKTFAIS